jgi:cysteine desulfurase
MIYADYNATTPLSPGARARMERALEIWGNPSSSHALGRQAAEFLEESRRLVAGYLDIPPTEIVFTSGGSEANTSALLGAALSHGCKGFRLLTSAVEHSSLRDTLPLLESLGTEITFAPLAKNGELDWKAFEAMVTEKEPHMVSLMTANNETGVLFPIEEVARLCREKSSLFHTDAVQALGKIPPERWLMADLISLSAHKIGGPKGTGGLIVRNGKKLSSLHFGGAQEIKRRGGTECTVGIAGFAGALSDIPAHPSRDVRDKFESLLLKEIADVQIQGQDAERIPTTSNVRFPGIPAEVLLSALDLDGICASAGSACSSGSIAPSHVLLAMGFSKTEAKECLRFSFSSSTTLEDVEEIASTLISHVKRIRQRRAGIL